MKKMKLFASKELRKAISKTMSKTQRKALYDGNTFVITIERTGKALKRWGNEATIEIKGKNMRILSTNLINKTWNSECEPSYEEAVKALDYFVYGDKGEYQIIIQYKGL